MTFDLSPEPALVIGYGRLPLASGRRVHFISGIGHGFWTFVRTYFFRAGFLDGPEGFLVARYHAQTTFYRYMKAWMKRRRGELK